MGVFIAALGAITAAAVATTLSFISTLGSTPSVVSQRQIEQQYVRAAIEVEKLIAVAMEEYAIDHAGAYPAKLDELVKGQYLIEVPVIPGSPTGARFRLMPLPAGASGYVISDDGSLRPTAFIDGRAILRASDKHPCPDDGCQGLLYYSQSGVFGGPL